MYTMVLMAAMSGPPGTPQQLPTGSSGSMPVATLASRNGTDEVSAAEVCFRRNRGSGFLGLGVINWRRGNCNGCSGCNGCGGSSCLGSGCYGSSCYGSGCFGSGCYGAGCYGAGCYGAGCYGAGCYGCTGSGCWGPPVAVPQVPQQRYIPAPRTSVAPQAYPQQSSAGQYSVRGQQPQQYRTAPAGMVPAQRPTTAPTYQTPRLNPTFDASRTASLPQSSLPQQTLPAPAKLPRPTLNDQPPPHGPLDPVQTATRTSARAPQVKPTQSPIQVKQSKTSAYGQ